jgi:hypothetical protein
MSALKSSAESKEDKDKIPKQDNQRLLDSINETTSWVDPI